MKKNLKRITGVILGVALLLGVTIGNGGERQQELAKADNHKVIMRAVCPDKEPPA